MGHNDYDPFLSFIPKDVYFMKLNGQKIIGPNEEIIIIPRGNGEDLIFKARAVIDVDLFEKIYPTPVPPKVMKRGGEQVQDFNDKDYLKSLDQYGAVRWAWIIVQSLKATESLEWETLNENDASSCLNWKRELMDSGFSFMEINRIEAGVLAANCLSEKRLEEARQRFTLSQVLQQER